MKKHETLHKLRSSNPRPHFPDFDHPGEAKLEMLSEEFVERANAIYEQHGGCPEIALDDWFEQGGPIWRKSA